METRTKENKKGKKMKVKFDLYSNFAENLQNVVGVNDWRLTDTYNVDYDELNGKKRIIITRYTDE